MASEPPVLTVLFGRHQKIKQKQYVTSSVGNIILSPYDVFTGYSDDVDHSFRAYVDQHSEVPISNSKVCRSFIPTDVDRDRSKATLDFLYRALR